MRIANCSGFYGDRLSAASEMVRGGEIDVLTGDYLAEVTLAILHRQKEKRPETGLRGLLEEGAAASTRLDPQAKTLAEVLRAQVIDAPVRLL
jgi:hypothetical protein